MSRVRAQTEAARRAVSAGMRASWAERKAQQRVSVPTRTLHRDDADMHKNMHRAHKANSSAAHIRMEVARAGDVEWAPKIAGMDWAWRVLDWRRQIVSGACNGSRAHATAQAKAALERIKKLRGAQKTYGHTWVRNYPAKKSPEHEIDI